MTNPLIGTPADDVLDTKTEQQVIIGLSGDDTITTGADADLIYGDFTSDNLLSSAQNAASFSQYGADGAWSVQSLADGHSQMTQSVDTLAGASYSVSFETAANIGEGHLKGAVEVLWNGEVVARFNTADAGFSAHLVELIGTGGTDSLTFRSIAPTQAASGPTVYTDTPIYAYEAEKDIGGEAVTVRAVAPGQPNLYQLINGTLYVFDVASESYTKAGNDASVVINGFGFNQEDDLFYGIAVKAGVDSLGNQVARSDVMMIDANGDSYRMGAGPYASWTGDFDDKGNLWSFHSSMDRVTVFDVDQRDETGDVARTVYKFPYDLVTDQVWDVAFDAASQRFYGVVRPSQEGENSVLMIVDVAEVATGGSPEFSTIDIIATQTDGVLRDGLPKITFGAAIVDGDGTLYVGGNGGDHDMNDATGTAGAIYRVVIDDMTGTAILELVTQAPKSYSNDGAADPRAIDPFLETDPGATVLIRSPELIPTPDVSASYDDRIESGGGADIVSGGFGADLIIGASAGDELHGDDGNDIIHGGAGPEHVARWVSVYDAAGNRYDPLGNLLPEDDDTLYGGDGDDMLYGSAGHDTLSGDAGADELHGGTGHDALSGGTGNDRLFGGRENDILSGGDGDDLLDGGTGADGLEGGAGHDTLDGGAGDDVIQGGAGNDVIDAGTGDDHISGGDGDDTIKMGSGNDIASSGAGADYLSGYRGDDLLDGGAGKDTLSLGAGNDVAYGGAGSDRFVFRFQDLDGSTDQIMDFTRHGGEADRLDLRALDLLSAGTDEETWVSQHMEQLQNGTVVVRLDTLTIELSDHDARADAFFLDIVDGLQL